MANLKNAQKGTTQKGKRKNWLAKLLGNPESQDIDAQLQSLSTTLDKLRIASKSVRRVQGGKATPAQLSAMKGAFEEAVMGIEEVLEELTDEVPEGLSQTVVTMVISALAEDSIETDDEITEEETVDDTIEDIIEEADAYTDNEDEEEKMDDEDEEKASKAVKAYSTIAKAVREQNHTVAELLNIITALRDGEKELQARVKALETAVKGKPRMASRDASTILDEDLAEQVKSQLNHYTAEEKRLADVMGLKLGEN